MASFLDFFKRKKPVVDPAPAPEVKKSRKELSDKERATAAGEPYVAIVSMDVDPENLHQGAFELDWNSIFITRLVKAGYMMKKEDTDAETVDRWFQNVCRNVVMETWEQEEAIRNSDPNIPRFTQSRDLGDGRREVS